MHLGDKGGRERGHKLAAWLEVPSRGLVWIRIGVLAVVIFAVMQLMGW